MAAKSRSRWLRSASSRGVPLPGGSFLSRSSEECPQGVRTMRKDHIRGADMSAPGTLTGTSRIGPFSFGKQKTGGGKVTRLTIWSVYVLILGGEGRFHRAFLQPGENSDRRLGSLPGREDFSMHRLRHPVRAIREPFGT